MSSDLLRPYEPTRTDPFDLAKAGHLLRRAGFGGSLDDRERAVREGPTETIDRLTEGRNFDPVDRFHAVTIAKNDAAALRSYRVWRMLDGSWRLRERMSHLLHDWFATSLVKVGRIGALARQLQLFDLLGLQRFDDLLLGVCQDPAMLRWLDNDRNVRGRPNENLARELFELFALGRAQGYDEQDVREAARALTGWTVRNRRFRFDRRRHDPGRKSVLGETGPLDGTDVVRLACGHPASARFVARKLLEFFVHPSPTPVEVEAVADAYSGHDRDLGMTVRELLGSRLFHAPRAWRSRIKDPLDLVVGTVRALGVRAAPRELANEALAMGLAIGEPPSVEGWPRERAWLTSATWLRRANFAGRLARGGFHSDPAPRAQLQGRTPRDRAAHAVLLLHDGRLGEASQQRLDAFLRTSAAADDTALLQAVMILPEGQLL